jgi:hypothetical protein
MLWLIRAILVLFVDQYSSPRGNEDVFGGVAGGPLLLLLVCMHAPFQVLAVRESLGEGIVFREQGWKAIDILKY